MRAASRPSLPDAGAGELAGAHPPRRDSARLAAIGAGMRQCDGEAERDAAVLRFVARFAFVTAAPLAARWGVSEQRMRARVARLERERRVRRVRDWTNEPAAIYLTEAGANAVGLSVRGRRTGAGKPGHELAIIKRVIAIERHFAERQTLGRVLTEREMRRAEGSKEGRYSIAVHDHNSRQRRRWPDYVAETPDGRTAVELEFSAKAQRRLDSIVAGYLDAGRYDYIDFLVLDGDEHRSLRTRLQHTIDAQATLARGRRLDLPGEPFPTQPRVVEWYDPLPAVHAGIHPFPPLQHKPRG